jgi:general secretion pathway protein D
VQTLESLRNVNRSKIVVSPTLGVTLNLKKTDGDLNTLANPRIRVRQHEKAKIHIGSRYPIITNTVTPSAGASAVVTGSIQYIDLGLKLEVEPDIHMDGEVGIKTSLEVNSKGGDVSSGDQSAPIINSRTVNTVLRLKDGETQVLAGLIDDQDSKSAVKVPGLGDIPLLGRLFSSNTHDKKKTELILAITPHIIRNIHQPDADLAAYWSGTDGTVRSRPITVEKMDTMKVESRGASILPGASSGPIRVPQPINLPINDPTAIEQNGASSTPETSAKPAAPANRVTPSPGVAPVTPSAAIPRVVPRSPIVNSGSAGMSDAVVDPAQAQ